MTHLTNRKTTAMKKEKTPEQRLFQAQRSAERAQAIAYARLISHRSKEARRKAQKETNQ